MDYIKENKKAWEQAFENRDGSYAKDLLELLNRESNPFFHEDFYAHLKPFDFTQKTIGQFCANNGRELLQLAKENVAAAVGFELASNMVDYANGIAKAMHVPATFVQTDILALPSTYDHYFDYGLITVGAIAWFESLHAFFKKVATSLKPGATLFIHEIHPTAMMLGSPGEDDYIPTQPKTLLYDYFENKVWKEHSMTYMSDHVNEAHTFTSFSHNLSDLLSALIDNGLTINVFKEYDYCVGNLFDDMNHQGVPLSLIIVATKNT